MARSGRNNNNTNNTKLNQKIDALNSSINDLVDVLERISTNTKETNTRGNNPFIRPGSRRYKNQRERDKEFYYEWSQYYKPPKRKKKWVDMSDDEKEEYNKIKNRRKKEAQDYVRRSNEREDLYRDLRSSRFGSTSVGRYVQNVMERNQKIQDYGMMGKYMNANADKLGKGLFGAGKAGKAAARGIGFMGKAIGSVSKLLGGPFVTAVLFAIDVLQSVGEKVSEWKETTAKMYEHQTKQEKLQFELSKQRYVIENQMNIENISAIGDKQLKMLDAQSSIMLDALKLSTEQYVKGIETSMGAMTKGINQTAYDAASYSIDAASNYQKILLHKGQREQEYGRYVELRNLQQEGKIAGLKAERGLAETRYTADSRKTAQEFKHFMESEHYWRNIFSGADNNYQIKVGEGFISEDNNTGNKDPFTGKNYKPITNANQTGIGNISNNNAVGALVQKGIGVQKGVHAKESAMLDALNTLNLNTAEYVKTAVDAEYQLATTQKDYSNQIADKLLDVQTQGAETIIDAATEVRKMWLNLAQKIEQYTENFDKVVNDLGINMGYTNKEQLFNFKTSMFKLTTDVAAKFGKEIEDLAKLQSTYVETTGRNKIFGERDYGNLTALGMYLGDDSLAASYASEMEIFNSGVSDSVDMLDEVLQDVNKIGLNGRKYTKTLVDNLKLAQKYNFKGGTKGLMEMAKWAENTRFNMNSLSGMLDKVSEGGLEGIITQGAQFQVLGGHAAMNADPIAMMFERYADPQAFAKRMQDMTIGYGSFNRETGETEFSGTEQMLMEQIAKVQGRSYEDVANEVRARDRKKEISRSVSSGFTDDELSYIANTANYNKKTGSFEVKVKQADGTYGTKSVDELTKSDLLNLMPAEHNERMEDYMATIIDLLSKTKGEETREKMIASEATYTNTIDQIGQRVATAIEEFNLKYPKYVEEIKLGQEEATKQYKNYFELAKAGNEAVDSKANEIQATASSINVALLDTARIIQEANAKIASAGGIGYTAPKTDVEKENNIVNKAKTKLDELIKLGKSYNVTKDKEAREKLMLGDTYQPVWDGIIKNNNTPIISQADNVTKINDGLVASDPKDVAIFAKDGGPIGNFLSDLWNDVHGILNGKTNGNSNSININMNGTLQLSSNGTSINIIEYLQNDPISLRILSRMIVKHMTDAYNGGRGTLPIGVANT